jgi:predicted transcriptional regulator
MSTAQQRDSWNQTQTELGPRQREVLDALAGAEPVGLSAWELSDRLRRLVHAVRPRLTELKLMGRIYQSGERFCRITMRNEAVWRILKPSGQLDLL